MDLFSALLSPRRLKSMDEEKKGKTSKCNMATYLLRGNDPTLIISLCFANELA